MLARTAATTAIVCAAMLVTGCASNRAVRGPVDVLRYNLGTPVQPGPFSLEPLRTGATISDEYRGFAQAVAREMGDLGFTQVTDPQPSAYIVDVAFTRTDAGSVRRPPAISLGLGGGTGGYRGGGVGGGMSTGIGGGLSPLVTSDLSAKIRRRTDSTVVWEGSARTTGTPPTSAAEAQAQADRLADALFRGFPGQSGLTTTVP